MSLAFTKYSSTPKLISLEREFSSSLSTRLEISKIDPRLPVNFRTPSHPSSIPAEHNSPLNSAASPSSQLSFSAPSERGAHSTSSLRRFLVRKDLKSQACFQWFPPHFRDQDRPPGSALLLQQCCRYPNEFHNVIGLNLATRQQYNGSKNWDTSLHKDLQLSYRCIAFRLFRGQIEGTAYNYKHLINVWPLL